VVGCQSWSPDLLLSDHLRCLNLFEIKPLIRQPVNEHLG
jgi:hypothetical protein